MWRGRGGWWIGGNLKLLGFFPEAGEDAGAAKAETTERSQGGPGRYE